MILKSDLLTIDGFIKHWAQEAPDTVAMTFQNMCLDYKALDILTLKIANMLCVKGLKKGDRIVWIGKNSYLYFALFYGAARIGVVIAPIGWRLAPAEWAYILNDTHAKLVFTGEEFDGALNTLRQDIPHVQEILTYNQTEKEIAVFCSIFAERRCFASNANISRKCSSATNEKSRVLMCSTVWFFLTTIIGK